MTLPDLLRQIEAKLQEWARTKKTGQVSFDVNLSQGGIGACDVHTKERLRDVQAKETNRTQESSSYAR